MPANSGEVCANRFVDSLPEAFQLVSTSRFRIMQDRLYGWGFRSFKETVNVDHVDSGFGLDPAEKPFRENHILLVSEPQ
jgi:hypothetical protein